MMFGKSKKLLGVVGALMVGAMVFPSLPRNDKIKV